MSLVIPSARALADAVLSAVTNDQALRQAAEIFARATRSPAIELTLDAGGRTCAVRYGSGAPCESPIQITYGAFSLIVAHCAENAGCDELAEVLGLAFHARLSNESATIDALTGVNNRAALERRLRESAAAALLMIDIDNFKTYNDALGHLAGDAVLRRVAHAASASLQRADDFFARYGGEEFVAVLADVSNDDAFVAAERMREAVRALGIPHSGGKTGRITVSIGVGATLAQADSELYRAKAGGRDRVCGEGYAGSRAAGTFTKPYVRLLGRENELDRILNTIDQSPVVTITGSSGTGKTRLAFNAACMLASRYTQIVFIDAWSALDADDLGRRLQAIATAGRSGLAVLDGCEHLTQSVNEVIAQMRVRGVSVLATSRVPLGVRDENVIRLGGLDNVSGSELFARSAEWAGALVDPRSSIIENLQRRLGGTPSSIVAAAIRLGSTSPSTLLDEISERGVIISERSNLQSLVRDVFGALDDAAAALATASAFASPFGEADAAAVYPGRTDGHGVAQSLVKLHELGLLCHQDGRWTLIGSLRDACAEEEATRAMRRRCERAHLEWCLERFNEFERLNGRVESQSFIDSIAPIAKEIETALQRALTDRVLTPLGMELCWNASRYWFATTRFAETYRWCDAFLDTGRGNDLWRLRLLTSLARISFMQGRISDMELYALQALPLAGSEPSRRSAILNYLGIAAKQRGETENAMSFFRESRDASLASGNRRGEAVAISSLGSVSMDLEVDYESAISRFESGVRIFRELGDQLNAVTIESNLVESLACAGELERARTIGERILPEAHALENISTLLLVLSTYGTVLELSGDAAALCSVAARALELAVRLEPSQRNTLYDLCARLHKLHGNKEQAILLFVAAEWFQIREGQQVLPIERYHHGRAFSELGVDAQAQRAAMIAVRGLSEDDLLRIAAEAVSG